MADKPGGGRNDAGRTEKMKENDAEIYDRFYTDIAFGTGGMRGLMGAGTNRINRYTVRRATLGFAQYLKNTAAVMWPGAAW